MNLLVCYYKLNVMKFLKITNTSTNKVEKLNHNIIIQSGKVPTIKDEVNS